ncbi:hypothetical protein PPL_11352 [Heterostelium album PN500]|uniref:Carbohydrate binding domain-containing protein n=1 Tax=Heterostelium pallidum (strain ATCC 26659 / Pp 5 / PN500) TaxID=670386 RepID=D3BT60_HETP5|nr:hypothetical protein PPL_11352 [Heterostelium album PN500]EFA75277.1 hypothetical protein PPL_11352 [Heterostelium album PN500]|eukprot:XP_020427411.1 hypothetical protein PPL_11352 [Heterostelium album PN500]
MKVLISLFVLMAVALTSAHYNCGSNICNPYYSCVLDGHDYGCIFRCDRVILTQKVVKQWTDDNGSKPYTQVEVTIRNNSPRPVNNVVIGAADGTLNIRDATSIWNIAVVGADFTLPSYASTLGAGQTFTFGYINKGNQPANMYLKYVHVL